MIRENSGKWRKTIKKLKQKNRWETELNQTPSSHFRKVGCDKTYWK